MNASQLHPLPHARAVLAEQFRFVGYAIRREAVAGAALMLILTIGLAYSIRVNQLTIDFEQEFLIAFTLLGLMVPLAVWKGQDRSKDAQLWTLPVDHRSLALLRVSAGWFWLIVAVLALLAWLISLVILTGGTLIDDGTRIMLGTAGEVSRIDWRTPSWMWLIPFTAATVAYLFASAFALATEHPWRWIAGGCAILLVSAVGGEAGLEWLVRGLIAPVVHRYGVDTLLTGGGPSLNTAIEIDGTTVRAWRALPSASNWAVATLLWSGAGILAVWAATLRFRENGRRRSAPARSRVTRVAVAAALVLLLPGSGAAQHFPSDDSIGALAKPFIANGRSKGLVIGVLEADGSKRIIALGSAGEGAANLAPNSLFEIGSITKSMTATLLADMVANGKVSLSDPVSKFLPGVKIPAGSGRAITLLDLATHHSGLPRMAAFDPVDDKNPYAHFSTQHLYDFLASWKLEREPGASFAYSNVGYGLLGHALARAAGTTFEELVTKSLLRPLGMMDTRYGVSDSAAKRMTKGHDVAGKITPHWQLTEPHRGAGGLTSSAEDLLVFLDANVGAPQSALERAMRETHAPRAKAEEREIGLAWFTRTVNGRKVVFNGGDTGGYHSFIGFDPQKEVGLVLLSNSDSQDPQLLMFAMSLLAPTVPDTTLRDVPLKAEDIARYEGLFDYVSNGAPRKLRFYGENGLLKGQIVGGPLIPLRHQGDHTFAATVGPMTIRIVFNVDAAGHASTIVIHQRGQEIPGKRAPSE